MLNILKPKNVILCRSGSRITVNLKLNMRFPINHFSIIVRPLPCTARCVLSCADISYFISGSVAVDRRLNAASKKENNTEECPYIFSSDVSWKTIPCPFAHNTDEKNQALKVLFVFNWTFELGSALYGWETYLEPCQFSR